MKKYRIAVLFIVFLLQNPFMSFSQSDIFKYIYRIRILPKNQKNYIIQTGFKVNEKAGIFTALHGVINHENIVGKQDGKADIPLRLESVDIAKDIAYLLPNSPTNFDGLEMNTRILTIFEDVYVTGFPANLPQLEQKQVKIGNPKISKLSSFLEATYKESFKQRKSPDIEQLVIRIHGPILKGHSGSPITNSQNQVIGMISGGIPEGVQTSWCVPLDNLDLRNASSWEIRARLDSDDLKNNIRQLFDITEDFPSPPENFSEILIKAIEERNQYEVANILKKYPNPNVVKKSILHESALIIACNKGDLEIAKLLLNNGANINFQDDIGQTALYVAVGSGNIELVQYLVTKGANLNSRIGSNYQNGNYTNWTPLKFSNAIKFYEISKYLKNKGAVEY